MEVTIFSPGEVWLWSKTIDGMRWTIGKIWTNGRWKVEMLKARKV